MAELDSTQLVKFSNERIRTIADQICSLYQNLQAVELEYVNQTIGSIINAGGAENLIADGSEQDGRPRITGGAVYNVITLVGALRAAIEADGRLQMISGVQVNGFGN